ncbi:gonadotropin-releasing hormone II receptor-like [Dermacentor andersoni]|uniref:gonadotropin-releasing hormone II receptor-like n=1 Tax=Dermacentor andersoni TaxID=34620 RepID=UPI003B3B778A
MSSRGCGERGLGGVPLSGALASPTNNDSTNATAVVVFPDSAVWDGPLVQRVVTLSVIMFFTLAGNAAIVAVLARPRAAMRSSSRVNLFILHLAVGDLAVGLFTQTSEILFEVSGSWVLGALGCKLVVYVQMVTLASTTFILASMSYDRYAAICRPLESRSGLRRAKAMLVTSWALAFIFAIPQLFIFVEVQTGVTVSGQPHMECLSVGYTRHWQRQLYFSWLTLYILVVPGLLISACYLRLLRVVWTASAPDGAGFLVAAGSKDRDQIGASFKANGKGPLPTLRRCAQAHPLLPRARAKTLKLTVCIIASFMLCWIPYFAVHNVRIHSHYCIKVPRAVIVFAETVALLNSAVNPIFYGLFNVHIRRGLCEILCRGRGGGRSRSCYYGRDSTLRQRGLTTAQVVALTTSTCAPDASSLASPALSNGRLLQLQQLQDQDSVNLSNVEAVPLVAINGNAAAACEV